MAHRLYKDISGMFTSILSCYMKKNYVKESPLYDLDPRAGAYVFLPKKQMYLGINVAKQLNNVTDHIHKDGIIDFLNRSQQFLIELCDQIKTRLPLENTLLKELAFLDPQEVVYSEYVSLTPLLTKFPNLVPEGMEQIIDNEFRNLHLDPNVADLLARSTISPNVPNVETFWVNIGKI